MASKKSTWPVFQFNESKDTISLLHLWIQIVGKVKLKKSPWQNHFWHCALHVNYQGLTTNSIPYENGIFEIMFDFIHHELKIKTSSGTRDRFSLGGQTVASFYEMLMEKLEFLGIEVTIDDMPEEVIGAIPFSKNTKKVPYQANEVQKFWKVLVHTQNVLTNFRSGFIGKQSPIHFFWNSFDLSYSRYSGKPLSSPENTEGENDLNLQEVFTVGFMPGNLAFPNPCFFAQLKPTLPSIKDQKVSPEAAEWKDDLDRFILPYDVVQKSDSPKETLLSFFQSSYDACANLAEWNRKELEAN